MLSTEDSIRQKRMLNKALLFTEDSITQNRSVEYNIESTEDSITHMKMHKFFISLFDENSIMKNTIVKIALGP